MTDKLCKDCECFHIIQQPLPNHYDAGLAECKKFGLVTDFFNMREFNRLICDVVQGGREEVEHD